MKSRVLYFIGKLVAIAVVLTAGLPAFSQGLRFAGLEKDIKERTSFDVFNGRSKVFRAEVNLDFQIYMYPEANARFGYFFRIIEEGVGKRVWNLSYNAEGNSGPVVLRFNEEGNKSLIIAEFNRQEFPELKWTGVSLSMDFKKDKIQLAVGDKLFEGDFQGEKPVLRAGIVFGVKDYIIDVPSFALRNLRVSDARWEESFPFNESTGEYVHNDSRKAIGRVVNPGWMVNESSTWRHICSLGLESHADYGYDSQHHRFYYFDKDSLYFFHPGENRTEIFTYRNTCPVNLGSSANFLLGDKLVVYEPSGHMNSKRTSVATLDLDNFSWNAITYDGIGNHAFHHTGFYNPVDTSYCIFGGYGYMTYNSGFWSISRKNPKWERRWEDCTDMCPRYFVSSGTDGEIAYFFGGMGNRSGEQVVGRRYFYDFHRLDMRTGEMDLLWTLPQPEENYVPVKNMVIDDGYAYVLCYPEYKSDSELSLHRMRLTDGEEIILDNTVYICSDRLLTNAALYLDEDMEKLFAVTRISRDDVSSKLDIYQIGWPVIFDSQTYEDISRRRLMNLMIALPVLLLLIAIASALLYRRRNRKKEDLYIQTLARRKNRVPEQPRPNTISLFGQFEVIDADGKNISNLINGQLRDIFLLIVKYSKKEGIGSERLSKIIWPDKEEDKVKNSRGVAINKLRSYLSGVSGLSIVYENGSYKLVLDDVSQCDYLEFYFLTHDGKPDIGRILSIASKGKFLGFSDNEIFDSWKSGVEDKAISLLHEEAQTRIAAKDWATVMEIVDVLFILDPLDEQALHFSIRCLKTLRHSEDARVRYADFANEYRSAYGEEYPVPFNKI